MHVQMVPGLAHAWASGRGHSSTRKMVSPWLRGCVFVIHYQDATICHNLPINSSLFFSSLQELEENEEEGKRKNK